MVTDITEPWNRGVGLFAHSVTLPYSDVLRDITYGQAKQGEYVFHNPSNNSLLCSCVVFAFALILPRMIYDHVTPFRLRCRS